MKRNIFYIIFIAISGIFLSSCAEDSADKIDYASLVKGTPEIVTGSTIVKNYGIMLTVEGSKVVSGDPITERGVCVSTDNNPQVYTETETGYTYGKVFAAKSVNEDGTFTAVLTGLVPETSYYYRSYVTNASGVHYGEVKTLKSAALPTVVAKQVSSFWGATFDVEVAHIPDANLYVLQKIYTGVEEVDDTAEGGLYDINITINANGSLTVAKQPAWKELTGYGVASVQGSGTVSADGKTLTLTLTHTVAAGSFGSAKEVITLP